MDKSNGRPDQPKRTLSMVLLRITLLLVFGLGTSAALVQLWIDLEQEKGGVEVSAQEFLNSVAPSAASAAYNFFDPAAEQVVEGLMTQRAIVAVRIENNGQVMIERSRVAEKTLPAVGPITAPDEVVLSQLLVTPPETGRNEVIGMISITVDRSLVPPAIVNRMFSYFLLATLKNIVLGVALIAIVYGALARHIVSLAEATHAWAPGAALLRVPPPPRLLHGTELELLGNRIRELAETASGKIQEIEASRLAVVQSNSELSQRSETLTQAVQARTNELQLANEKLMLLAERDELTGLSNRRAFDAKARDAFDAAKKSGSALTILLIDVDYFKNFNDFYGHQKGDDVLATVGAILSQIAEDADALVARYGGEEFVALIAEDQADQVKGFAQRIHDAIATSQVVHQRSNVSDRLTVSIGTASYVQEPNESQATVDTVLIAADEALYEAKRNGRNRTELSTQDIRRRVKQQRSSSKSLLSAIEEQQFEPYFQPQYDARELRLIGAEALVRWVHPDGKVYSPPQFMDAAAENGLVQLIDRIVIERVGAFLTTLAESGSTLPRLSLNAPKDGIYDEEFVRGVIELSDSSSTSIAIELLETAIIDAPDETFLWQIDRLKEAGIEIEIDDFGTGHTSIVGLMAMTPKRLKIAKELIIPMEANDVGERVVKSVIDIARALDVEVLAEGVETEAVSNRLIEFGCPFQQGFFLARPMPSHKLSEALHSKVVQHDMNESSPPRRSRAL